APVDQYHGRRNLIGGYLGFEPGADALEALFGKSDVLGIGGGDFLREGGLRGQEEGDAGRGQHLRELADSVPHGASSPDGGMFELLRCIKSRAPPPGDTREYRYRGARRP